MYNMYQLKQSKNEETDKLWVFSFFPYSGKFYSQGQLNSEPPDYFSMEELDKLERLQKTSPQALPSRLSQFYSSTILN